MADPLLDEKVVLIERALTEAAIPHAFGGALALAYYAEPRATIDVDVNVFVSPDELERVLGALEPLGMTSNTESRNRAVRDGQARFAWGATPIDVFFSYDEFHEHAARRVRRVPLGDAEIAILAPEDLLVCKAVFDRRKDWLDIEQMLFTTAGDLDVEGVRAAVVRFVGEDDQRVARLDTAIAEILGA